MNYLVDTNVISELAQPNPSLQLVSWLDAHDAHLLISVLTMGEVGRGIELLPPGKRRRQLEAWFVSVEEWANDRLLLVDRDVTRNWAVYASQQSKKGRVLDVMDSLLAATALAHRLTVVTRNTDDFPDVPTINPW